MAEAFLKSYDWTLNVFSAGTQPAEVVHPSAVLVMKEVQIDISKNKPKSVDKFLNDEFDWVITVCGGAKESCPTFSGIVKNRLHMDFDDPASIVGSDEFIHTEFRRVRNEIARAFRIFLDSTN
jgi:arsenate reductase